MPRRENALRLACGRYLLAGSDTAAMREIVPDVVYEVLLDQVQALPWADVDFAHCDGRARPLPDQTERVEMFRTQWVFQIKQFVRLEILSQGDGLVGCDALVHIMQQPDVAPERFSQVLE